MTGIASGATLTLRHSTLFDGYLQTLGAPSGGAAGGVAIVAAGVTLTNQGTLVAQGGKGHYNNPGTQGGTLVNNGVVNNTGAILIDGGQGTYIDEFGAHGGGGGLLDNVGVLTNNGQLVVQGGAGGQGYVSAGAFAGTVTDSGTLTNSGTVDLRGGYGGFGIGFSDGGPGATLAVSGSLVNSGLLSIGGGGPGSNVSGAGSGAVLNVSGVATNLGTITAGRGQYYYGTYLPGGGQIVVSGLLKEQGLITLQAAYNHYQGELTVAKGGTLVLGGTNATIETSSAFESYEGQINNSGVIVGHGLISDVDFVNNGVVVAAGGLLTIDGAISGTGLFEVGKGGTLDLNGTITTSLGVISPQAAELLPSYVAMSASLEHRATTFGSPQATLAHTHGIDLSVGLHPSPDTVGIAHLAVF